MRRALLLAMVFTAAVSGCGESGPATATVTGVVNVDGKPLEQGRISFVAPDRKSPPTELLIANGTFKGEVPLGPKSVSIFAQKSYGKIKLYAADPNSATVDDIRDLKLEAKASALTFDVPAAGGKFDQDLRSAK